MIPHHRLAVLSLRLILSSLCAVCCAPALWARAPQSLSISPLAPRSVGVTTQGTTTPTRTRYRIDLKLDFDGREYTGSERVLWVNRDDRPASVIYFHLYSNMRGDTGSNVSNSRSGNETSDLTAEPRLDVMEVRALSSSLQPLAY